MSGPADAPDHDAETISAAYDGEAVDSVVSLDGVMSQIFDRVGDAVRQPSDPPAGLLTAQISHALETLHDVDQVPTHLDTDQIAMPTPTPRRGLTAPRRSKTILIAAASVAVIGVGMIAALQPDVGSVDQAELSDAARNSSESSEQETTASVGGTPKAGDPAAENPATGAQVPSFGAPTDLGDFTDDQQLLALIGPLTEASAGRISDQDASTGADETQTSAGTPNAPETASAEPSPLAPACPFLPGDVQLGSANLGGLPVLVLQTPAGLTVLDPYGCGRRVVAP